MAFSCISVFHFPNVFFMPHVFTTQTLAAPNARLGALLGQARLIQAFILAPPQSL
jgi:hypothetical protein